MRDPPLFLFLFDCPDGGYEQYRMYCKYLYITFSSAARRLCILVWAMVIISLAGTGCVQAQTEKTAPGQYGPTPYISHAEFQNISMGGETVLGKSSGSRTTFRDILTVASLEEVSRRFGEPASTEYNRFPEGSSTDYVVTLMYDGFEIKYRKISGEIKLQSMVITSEDRFLKIGGAKLRPGMSTKSLSSVIRKEVEDDDDGVAAVRVAQPGKSENPRSIPNGQPAIAIEVDKSTNTLKKIEFSRIIS